MENYPREGAEKLNGTSPRKVFDGYSGAEIEAVWRRKIEFLPVVPVHSEGHLPPPKLSRLKTVYPSSELVFFFGSVFLGATIRRTCPEFGSVLENGRLFSLEESITA